MKCRDCLYFNHFEELSEDLIGDCRRYPPVIAGDPFEAGLFPVTNGASFCGEFKSVVTRKKAPAKVYETLTEFKDEKYLLGLKKLYNLTSDDFLAIMRKAEALYQAKQKRYTEAGVRSWIAHFCSNEMSRKS